MKDISEMFGVFEAESTIEHDSKHILPQPLKQEQVKDFFKLAQQPWREDCSSWPDEKSVELSRQSIIGEVLELCVAIKSRNIVEVADGLADIMYFLYGAALRFGIPLDEIWEEVHRSNMTKKWPTGTPREVSHDKNGKLLKPPVYSKPDLLPILRKAGANV